MLFEPTGVPPSGAIRLYGSQAQIDEFIHSEDFQSVILRAGLTINAVASCCFTTGDVLTQSFARFAHGGGHALARRTPRHPQLGRWHRPHRRSTGHCTGRSLYVAPQRSKSSRHGKRAKCGGSAFGSRRRRPLFGVRVLRQLTRSIGMCGRLVASWDEPCEVSFGATIGRRGKAGFSGRHHLAHASLVTADPVSASTG